MSQEPESKVDRQQRRRIRRWQRRARLAAPFLAVPAMLGLLIASVDLVEYQPAVAQKAAPARAVAEVRRAEPMRSDALVESANVTSLSVMDSSSLLEGGPAMPTSSSSALPSTLTSERDGAGSAFPIEGSRPAR